MENSCGRCEDISRTGGKSSVEIRRSKSYGRVLGHWESGAGELLERWPREANGIVAEFKRFDHETRSLAGVSVYLSFAEKGVRWTGATKKNLLGTVICQLWSLSKKSKN